MVAFFAIFLGSCACLFFVEIMWEGLTGQKTVWKNFGVCWQQYHINILQNFMIYQNKL